MRVVVKGDAVGGFDEFLFVPETFKRDFEETRSRANLLTSIFGVFWVALALSVLVILAQRYRAGGLQWRSSTVLGVAVLAAMMLAQLNAIPLIQFNYNTTQSMGSFYMLIVMTVVMASVLTGSVVVLAGRLAVGLPGMCSGIHICTRGYLFGALSPPDSSGRR